MSTYGVPRRRISPRSIALNLVLAAAIGAALFTWFRIANVLTEKPPVAASTAGGPSSFAWGDQVFSSQAQLAAWLHSKGIDFSVWLRRHPDAARILGAQAPPSPAAPEKRTKGASKTVSKTVSKATQTTGQASRAIAAGQGAHPASNSAVVTLLAVLALLLSALAVAPSRIWRLVLGRVHIRFAERVYGFEERVYPAAAAAAILIALVIGLLSN